MVDVDMGLRSMIRQKMIDNLNSAGNYPTGAVDFMGEGLSGGRRRGRPRGSALSGGVVYGDVDEDDYGGAVKGAKCKKYNKNKPRRCIKYTKPRGAKKKAPKKKGKIPKGLKAYQTFYKAVKKENPGLGRQEINCIWAEASENKNLKACGPLLNKTKRRIPAKLYEKYYE